MTGPNEADDLDCKHDATTLRKSGSAYDQVSFKYGIC